MSEPTPPVVEPTAEPTVEGRRSRRARLADRFNRLASWAFASRLRMIVLGVAGMLMLGAMVAGSSYFGQVALEPVDLASVELAIAAADEGRYDDAKLLVGQMQRRPATPRLLGGALFVLGAVKAHEAELEVSPERRRLVHEIAVRYMRKARTLGLPGKRQGRAAYLLGKSLVGSGQWKDAIAALEEALRDESQPATEIRALLVAALLEGTDDNVADALKQNELVLADPKLSPENRERALVVGAGAHLDLHQFKQARETLAQLPKGSSFAATASLLAGRLEIEEAQSLGEGSPERAAKLSAALSRLQEAVRLDVENGPLTRQASLWMARRLEANDEHAAALAEYDRIGSVYVDTPEGLAAMLAAADYYRRGGQFERAMLGYRQVLRAIDAQLTYDSSLMPLSEVRQRLTTAFQQYVDEERFAEALALVEHLEPVFGRVSCAEWRAKTSQQWGELQLARSNHGGRPEEVAARLEARARLRAAGLAYEELARLRYAARQFSDDLWSAADCYFKGQSFTQAVRLLQEYLHHEAKRQNSLALLKLGQARLAIGEYDQATVTLEECIDMYPDDAVAHQARLECARAYQQRGRLDVAEQMLLINLVGGTLKPASPEWRNSLFELGGLLYESERYDEAIEKLQEAVERYPAEESALVARYTIARAYHDASEAPAKRLQAGKTENERQAARADLIGYLTKAHESYQAVQRKITLRGRSGGDELDLALLRNCYLMQGAVLFELRRFEDALQAYGNVIASYQDDPIALESFVQVASCWRRLNQPVKSRVTLDQAQMVLKELPPETDFLTTTNFSRQQWESLLTQMSRW